MEEWERVIAEILNKSNQELEGFQKKKRLFEKRMEELKKYGLLHEMSGALEIPMDRATLVREEGILKIPFVLSTPPNWSWDKLTGGNERPFPQYWDQVNEDTIDDILFTLIDVDCFITRNQSEKAIENNTLPKHLVVFNEKRKESRELNEKIYATGTVLVGRLDDLTRKWLKTKVSVKCFFFDIDKEELLPKKRLNLLINETPQEGTRRFTSSFYVEVKCDGSEESQEKAWREICNVLVNREIMTWGKPTEAGLSLIEALKLDDSVTQNENGEKKTKRRL